MNGGKWIAVMNNRKMGIRQPLKVCSRARMPNLASDGNQRNSGCKLLQGMKEYRSTEAINKGQMHVHQAQKAWNPVGKSLAKDSCRHGNNFSELLQLRAECKLTECLNSAQTQIHQGEISWNRTQMSIGKDSSSH
jgi:hypothetical protein